MRLGVFGGTFNPIHYGHLRVAEEVRERLLLERVLFVPTGDPPLKSRDLAPAETRYAMVELALAGNECFAVSDVEYRRPGTSYSVDTAEELRRREPGAGLFFILGVDAFADLPLWREPERLTTLTDFVVMSRPGHAFASLAGSEFLDARPEGLGELDRAERDVLAVPLLGGRTATFVRVTPLGVSATAIRALCRAGKSIRYLLPAAVESFIMSHGLYAGA